MLRKNKPADLGRFTDITPYYDTGHENAPNPSDDQTAMRDGQSGERAAEAMAVQKVPVSFRAAAAGFVCGFALVSVAIMQPFLFLVLALFLAASVSTFYVAYGYDRFWQMMFKPLRLYVARHPENAGAIHAEIDRVAMRWDAILDRFPEAWVAALYLPDVSDIAAFAQQDAAKFELRMDSLAQAHNA